MADGLGPAVTILHRKLEEQLQAIADTKRTINMLLKMSGQDPMYPDSDAERSGIVRADQFYGKSLTTSAAEYLGMRQQACQADEIYRGLKAGGFDFDLQGWSGDDRDMVRNVAMSLSKNTGAETGKFHRLKNGSFGLRAWYDPDFLKRAKVGADTTASSKASSKKTDARRRKAGKKGTKAKHPAAAPSTPPPAALKEKADVKPKVVPLKPETEKPKSSAKEKSRPEADRTAKKGAAM
jgi:hypothetical protein